MATEQQGEPEVTLPVLGGAFGMAAETVMQNHAANREAFATEMQAVVRGGREDLWDALIPAFPDSMDASTAIGAPGQPTPQMVTEGLKGEAVNLSTDQLPVAETIEEPSNAIDPEVAAELQRMQGGQEMSRGM